jgi:hypothetical protein
LCSFKGEDDNFVKRLYTRLDQRTFPSDVKSKIAKIHEILDSTLTNQEKLNTLGELAGISNPAHAFFNLKILGRVIIGDDEGLLNNSECLGANDLSEIQATHPDFAAWVNQGITVFDQAIRARKKDDLVLLIQQYIAVFTLCQEASYPVNPP